MPLDCPLGKFYREDGHYNRDPVEQCAHCNFGDLDKEFDYACQAPRDITWERYGQLKEQYMKTVPKDKKTKKGFQEFVTSKT